MSTSYPNEHYILNSVSTVYIFVNCVYLRLTCPALFLCLRSAQGGLHHVTVPWQLSSLRKTGITWFVSESKFSTVVPRRRN